MRPHALGRPPLPQRHWTPRDSPDSKKGRIHRRIWGSSQRLPSPGLGINEAWMYMCVKPAQPPSQVKHFEQPRCSSTKVCTSKDRPRYFTFVSSVRLWDRGQLCHPSHLQADPSRPSLPCPRFVAHMNSSSGSLQLPWDFVGKPWTLSPGPLDTESRTAPRDVWKSAAHSRRRYPARSFCRLQFKPSSKPQPKSPPPRSKVPSGEEEEKPCGSQRETPPGTSEQNLAEESDANGECASREESWNGAEPGEPGADEVDDLRESFSPPQSRADDPSPHYSGEALSVSSQGGEISLDRDNNETALETWDRPLTSGASSCSDLSQLRCSSISWNSRNSADSEMQAGSSAPSDRIHLRNASPPAASSLYQSSVNLDQDMCGRHSTGSPLQVSTSSARKTPTERTPSFVEIWHDRLLKQWPILPPISPGSLEACSSGSDGGAMHSYGDLSAYQELDEIFPCTGSSLSHCTLGHTAEEISDSELTGRSSVSQTPWTSAADKTLAEARLSLIDHQGFDHHPDINQLEEQFAQTTLAESVEPMAREEREEEGGWSKINDSLAPHSPGNLPEWKSTPIQRNNNDDMDLSCHPTPTDWSHKAAQLNRTILSPGDTSHQCSTPVVPEPRTTALPENVHQPEVDPSPNKEGQGSSSPQLVNFLEKYCIFNREDLVLYKKKFQEVDNDNDGYLSCAELVTALKGIVPLGALTDSEEIYIYRTLESLDCHVTGGLTDLRLFTVMVSLAQKITALDGLMRSLIGNMDLTALDLKVYRAKQLFLCNLEEGSSTISVEQFLLELKAGGISRAHEEKVRQELQHTRELDLLDFLTYLPLFVLTHNSVVSNPLAYSPTF